MPTSMTARLLAALLATALLVAGCGSGSDGEPAVETPSVAVTLTPTESSDAAATSSTAPPPSSAAVPEFTIAGGEVSGPARITASVGERVRFTVTSDTADEVHVHGYDVTARVRPGRATTVTVRADIPGVFEVELEDSHLPLTQLRVTL